MSTDTALAGIKWPDQSVFREGVPYRPTDSCIFYAVQEACQHLRGEGLGESELQRFNQAKKRLDSLLTEAKKHGELTSYTSLAITLNFLVPYLGEKFIDVTSIFMRADDIQAVISTYPDPLAKYPFVNSEGQTYPTPLLAIVENPNRNYQHVFYVRDPADFEDKKQTHLIPGDNLVAMICVQAAQVS